MALSEAMLKKTVSADGARPITVCFVCTGNTCRSPMAAAVLNHLGGGAYKALSAGVSAVTGDVISKNSVLALKNAGIPSTPENDYEHHRAVQVSEELLERCDRVVAISKSHMMALIYAYPHMAERITVMPKDVPDPFMYGEAVYAACLESITEGIKETFAV